LQHHPSSVNNLLIQQLLDVTKKKTLFQFFANELAGIKKVSLDDMSSSRV